MTRHSTALAYGAALFLGVTLSAQQVRFDDVIRNLRNPDPKVRLAAVQLLHESHYPEAIAPIAPLVDDPMDQIQLEAIAAELSFYLVDDVPSKKRVGFLVEVRNPGRAAAAFDMGTLAVQPRPVPPELVDSLLKAVDDDNPKVRNEAIYTLGTIAEPPIAVTAVAQLVKALDHYDPAIRAAAARVAGRLGVESAADVLIKSINDSQPPVRYAAMRALGALRERRAVQTLTEQFTYYAKGEGAWSSLDALARIADPSSIPLFKLISPRRIRSCAARRRKDSGGPAKRPSCRRWKSPPATIRLTWRVRRWRSRSRSSGATTCRGWSSS